MFDNVEKRNAIIGRIRRLIAESGLSQAAFARRLELDPSNLSKSLSGRVAVGNALINRISAELGVSKSWIVNGIGRPDEIVAATGPATAEQTDGAPVYDIDITAGAISLARDFASERLIGRIYLPDVPAGCPVVKVSGDSMRPVIHDGSLLSIRQVDPAGIIFWGQIYVVVLDDYRMVKYLRRHDDREKVILHSANSDYDDIEVERSQIRNLFLVETVINIEKRC